jgi:monofunctional biosynthetic peptidoglycan transglycosylase
MRFSARRSIAVSGWPYLESRLALKIERALGSPSSALSALSPPPELELPARKRKPFGLARVLSWLLALFLGIHFVYIAATSLLILSYRYVEPSATVLMAYRAWNAHWKLEKPRHIALKRVPRYVQRMLISVEDGNFYSHHGVEIEAIERAYEINSKLKRPLYGGSTLSMQVARTLFLVPVKSYVRKYFELIATLELELFLPKDRILELYFNYAEWGKGVFGIEAAARHYYGRSVTKLSREESAKLIALLSSPLRYSPRTIERSGILRERYYYLIGRYVSAPATTAMPASPAPESLAAPAADAATSAGAEPSASAEPATVEGAGSPAQSEAVPEPTPLATPETSGPAAPVSPAP